MELNDYNGMEGVDDFKIFRKLIKKHIDIKKINRYNRVLIG